jgi:hypothetical protein
LAAAILVMSCGRGRAISHADGAADGQGSGGGTGGESVGSGGRGEVPVDARDFDGADGGFAPDFTARAGTALAAGAPSWVCATVLPNVPVADAAAARDAVGEFIAQVVGVPPTDIAVTVQNCGAGTASCAVTFAHDVSKSGGSVYNTVAPLAQELDANAAAVEETIWVPMKDGTNFAADVVMSGISDGVLVGMVVFNYPSTCP